MFFLKKRIRKGICMLLAGMLLAVCCAAAPAGSAVAADASVLPMYRRAVDFPAGDLSRYALFPDRSHPTRNKSGFLHTPDNF